MLYTDGIGVSILKVAGNDIKHYQKPKYKKKVKNKLPYIDEISKKELEELKEYKLLGDDPGKRHIMSIIDEKRKKLNYSALQRRKESGIKKFRKKIENMKPQRVQYIEGAISKYNSKTCDYEAFKQYIFIKNMMNVELLNYYRTKIFRNIRWRTYINVQKSEIKMINNIKNTYLTKKEQENGKEICMLIGNWSQPKQMRNYMPTPSIGITKLLFKHFRSYLVDEYCTSKKCHVCGYDTEKCMVRENPRPYKKGTIKIHSLLRCKNVNCNKYWDRDVNGSSNILKIGKESWFHFC